MSESGGSYKVGDLFHVPVRGDLKFEDPREVVADRHLTIEEKRAVLASWASDGLSSGHYADIGIMAIMPLFGLCRADTFWAAVQSPTIFF